MSIDAGSVYSELILNGDKYFSTLDKADSEMKSFESKLNQYGDKMEKAGKSWSTKVSAPIAGVGVVATKLGLDFQSAMSEVGAISGATGDDLAILEKKARDMGATTKFSASDAADGLKYMAMAGWDTNAMLEGLDGVLALAAASGEDLGLTSDIVTDALTAFGMQAKDAGQFADLLASASSNSNTNVALMGETFKYVAPLFGALGYSAEDAALATGLMANAGIKGSQAGTSLRAAVTNLMKPTDSMAIAMEKLGISVTDANGEMLPFKDVMDNLRGSFANLSEEQQAQYAATIFGKEAMSGMLAIINASEEDYIKLTKATTDYTGTAKEMSDMMQDNLKGRWEEFKSGLEEAALQIYDLLLPSLEAWLAKGQAFIDWFQALDDGTKKTILNIAGTAAAIGPLLIVGGKASKGLSSIIGLVGKFSGATTVATTATGTMTSGIGLAGIAAKAGALLFNPWTLGIAAAGVGAVALAKHLKEDSIPAIELFDETISESTKEAVGSFLDLEKQATTSLNQLAWSGKEVTEEMKENITGNFEQMKEQVVTKLEEQKTEALTSLDELFSKSTEMSEEEKNEILRITSEKYNEQIKKTEEGNARIKEILETAKKENRAITEEEKNEINKIKEDMKNDGIRLLSETETESLAIIERLKAESGKITAEMAAETVKNSKEQKDKAIANAEEEYQERLKYAATLRAEGSKESEELANKVVEEAQRQRDEAVKAAEEMHEKVVDEAKSQAKEHVREIDWETGEIMSKWDKLKKWFEERPIVRWIKTIFEDDPKVKDLERQDRVNPIGRNAHGANYWSGGLTWVGEQGPELIQLPKGSRVYSNQESVGIMGLDEEKLANAIIKGLKEEGLSKPAVIVMDNKAVGKGIVKIIDSELHTNNTENDIGRGSLEW